MRKCKSSLQTLELPKAWFPLLLQIIQQVTLQTLVTFLGTLKLVLFQECQIIPRVLSPETRTKEFHFKLVLSFQMISKSLWAPSIISLQKCLNKDNGHTPLTYGPLESFFSNSLLVEFHSKVKLKMILLSSLKNACSQFLKKFQRKLKIWLLSF